jgi:hypothetical protein
VTDFNTLANLAEIFGAFVVVGGLGFAVIQMQHYLPLEMVNELLGGVCVESWARLSQYTQDFRVENDRKTMSEWFQWLAERLKEHHARYGRQPAYEQFRDWRP